MKPPLASLPAIKKVGPKKVGLAFLRTIADAPAKANMATVRKLMKTVQKNGKSVTGVTLAPDGTVSVNITETAKATATPVNPWDTEFE